MPKTIDEVVLEREVRKLPAGRLPLLRLFTDNKIVTRAMLSNATTQNGMKVGGYISSLLRIEI